MLTEEQILSALNDYQSLSACIRTHGTDEIVLAVSALLKTDPEKLALKPMGGYSKGRRNGSYLFVLQDLKQNIDHYDWLYDRLHDEESKRVLFKLISFRFVPDHVFLSEAYDGKHPQYFDTGIVHCDENEVFVDCGGFIGDTIQSYCNVYKDYKKCYIYEPDTDNIEKIKAGLKDFHDITIRPAGVGEHSETVSFSGHNSSGSFLEKTGDGIETSLVSLDEDIDEPVTFIKMDVEGFEIPAITGAKRHITNDKPKLAICLYHIVSDLWEIPRIIDSLCPDHLFFIRHYEEGQNWETVLYAIPRGKRTSDRRPPKTAVTVMPYERPWSNVELIKDCGLIPYLLHKNHDMDVTMLGTSENAVDYPYAELIQGVRLKALPDYTLRTKLRYLAEHARDIDLLILRGCYNSCRCMAEIYKEYNPSGLIYCGLDANSWWMDRILWHEPEFNDFLDNCDILATSCTAMADLLKKKWHRNIEVITNGYYRFPGTTADKKDYSEKENIILTVGRLGAEQKATDILLKAFAEIADEIPSWKLRLAGSIEEGFRPFLDQFFSAHPKLAERIEFTGPIIDRRELSKEYENARIFALTSFLEGGAPNVIAEALSSGCVVAVTKIDAWEDCIDHGRCGKAADTGDTEGFSRILLSLCRDPELIHMSKAARLHAESFYDMEKNVEHIYRLISEI